MKYLLKKIIIFLRSIVTKIIRRIQELHSCKQNQEHMTDNQETEIIPSKENLVRGFVCPYPGCSFGTCQDTLYADPANAFFSVVDGVSEGMGQSYYVKLLSRYKSSSDNIRLLESDAENIHSIWKEYQEGLIAEGRMPRNAHRLYQEGKFAHATYIRLKFYPGTTESDNIRWKCAVLGDSALIHIHKLDDTLIIKHVLMSNENVRVDKFKYSDANGYYDFSQAPDQLDEIGSWLENEAYIEDVSCEAGDIFLLTTDHVSAWILDDSTNSVSRINQLLSTQTQEEFQELIDNERQENPETGRQNMGDDDSTALIIEIRDPQKIEFRVTAIIDPREKYEEEKSQKIVKNSSETIQNSNDFTLSGIENAADEVEISTVNESDVQCTDNIKEQL